MAALKWVLLMSNSYVCWTLVHMIECGFQMKILGYVFEDGQLNGTKNSMHSYLEILLFVS